MEARNVTGPLAGATLVAWALSSCALVAFANVSGCGASADDASAPTGSDEAAQAEAELVDLPFALNDAGDDLLLTYVDAEGAHTVHHVGEVPEAARAWVRVDSLTLPPDQRPADGRVFVADLRGELPTQARLMSRAAFDARVEQARPSAAAGAALAAVSGEVVLYGASWCGACRQARRFFEREGVAFVDRDIERDPGARDEMNRKARAAGVATTGIPVIDVYGTILTGFDEGRIRRLLARGGGGAGQTGSGAGQTGSGAGQTGSGAGQTALPPGTPQPI
ncbi:MAG: glutaredoxin family protein [Polyangiales bacterium]